MSIKYYILALLLMSFLGCVSAEDNSMRLNPSGSSVSIPVIIKKRLTAIDDVRLNMSYEEVFAILGDAVVIGHSQGFDDVSSSIGDDVDFRKITLPQPYRKETMEIDGRVYEVAYIFTHIERADGIVADDELTPLVFQDNRLITRGWDELFKFKTVNPASSTFSSD